MKKKELAIQLISPIDDEVISSIRNKLIKRINNGESLTPFGYWNDAPILRFSDPRDNSNLIVLLVEGEIAYFVRYKMIDIGHGITAARQVMVWREKVVGKAVKFADHVFFDILLPEYKVLVSDKQQSEKGRAFWQYAVTKAYERHNFVYWLKEGNKLIRVMTNNDFNNIENKIWGHDSKYMKELIVVSNHDLLRNTTHLIDMQGE